MSNEKYTIGFSVNPNEGGKRAIERLVEAYGFSTRQALCDHLGVSKSTMANRYLRDTFPSDWIIQCSLETGTSLFWLTTGNGPMFEDGKSDVVSIPRKKLLNGKLYDSNYYIFDKAFLPDGLQDPIVIVDGDVTYIADRKFDEVTDGKWLIEIENKTVLRNVLRMPNKQIKIGLDNLSFDCKITDVTFLSKIVVNIFLEESN
ncbi:phage repressor protein CI [Pectobacterium aroidearum]|uniref:phage repressor protein CI n=1 Tax=Pectobacterium aroidearum TaxID=1201031 RepID=UPI00262BD78B|nr:phage repressor protein CI [Pectobacterium aroidearum]WKA63671.1 phage repressor protein CI [Pectobacterium aroidearum]